MEKQPKKRVVFYINPDGTVTTVLKDRVEYDAK